MTELSQRVLVWELRHAIDRVMRKPWDRVARDHLDRLIDDNPRGVRGRHVLYNIGIARRDWLAAYHVARDGRPVAESSRNANSSEG